MEIQINDHMWLCFFISLFIFVSKLENWSYESRFSSLELAGGDAELKGQSQTGGIRKADWGLEKNTKVEALPFLLMDLNQWVSINS